MMKTKFICIAFLLAFAPIFMAAQSWQEVGQGGFSDGEAYSQKMALDGLTPYVAYFDDSNDRHITVKKYNGSSWESVGGESFGEKVTELDFAIENGELYVAYVHESNISVMKHEGGQWVYAGPSAFAKGDNISLSVSGGIPYVAFQDGDASGDLSVLSLTGSGWEYVGEAGFTNTFLPSVVDMEIDGSIIYVVFRDSDHNYKASVMKYENSNWSVVGEQGFSGGTHDVYNGLAIYNGEPYVTSWNGDAQGAVYKYSGSSWQQVGETISTGTGRSLSLAVSTLNELHIAYSDEGEGKQVFVKKLDGSSWVNVGEGVSKLSADNISMAFNTNGQPYLAYKDNWYIRRTTVMTYATTISSIEEGSKIAHIQLYPNPAENYLQISNTGNNPIASFDIYDEAGRLVKTHTSVIPDGTSLNYDISSIIPGLYYVHLRTKNGIITESFIKQ